MTVAESFAEFAAGLRQDAVPEGALHGARRCLVDWWGRVMLRDKRVRLRRPPSLPSPTRGEGAPAERWCAVPDPSLISDPEPSRSARVRARWSALPDNLRGGVWFLAGAAILTLMLALIKLAGQSLHVTEILFFRQATMVAIALPAIVHGYPESLKTRRLDLQLARIGVAFGAMTLGFTAVIHLPLAEVTTLGFTKTFFMTILGIVVLGEVVRARRWAALAAGFAGVLIILWPEAGSGSGIYRLASIASACLVA